MDSKSSNAYILAKYDVSGIQQYIFATNLLRENVGASCQVTKILGEYLPDSIREAVSSDDACVVEWEKETGLKLLEDKRIEVEIIYIGGGNAIVLFCNREIFQRVNRKIGKKAAENCQGLYLLSAYIETDMENFNTDMRLLEKKMAASKADMVRQPVHSPFPVVEQDNASHQPITHCYYYRDEEKDNENHYGVLRGEDMTEIRYQKRLAYQWSRSHRDKKLYPSLEGVENYDYPVEMESFCRSHGEDSHIAVVHIDGNGMGKQVQEVLGKYEGYEDGIPALREKSKYISGLFRDTYKGILLKLQKHTELFPEESEGENLFPLRPIVLDGDDFTFLCAADLAVPVAAGFLTELSGNQRKAEQKVTACAGIAFVHSHFPFYEAYQIAEETCSHAKKKWYESRKRQCGDNSYLDFERLKGSKMGRSQRDTRWQMRPYVVDEGWKELKSDSLMRLCQIIKEMEKKWPSNRLHKLYRAMLEGDEEMELLNREFISRGYRINELAQSEDWRNSPLYDALEMRGLCRTELLEEFLNVQKR